MGLWMDRSLEDQSNSLKFCKVRNLLDGVYGVHRVVLDG